VPELVQGRADGGLGEQGGGLLVAEPSAAEGVKVGGGQLDPRFPLGDEHRPGLAALQQARQEPGSAGLPDDDVDGAALRRTLACRLGRSRSSTSSASTSADLAAVS